MLKTREDKVSTQDEINEVSTQDEINEVSIQDEINEVSIPIISHLNRQSFEFKGRIFLAKPTIAELLVEAGITNIRIFRAIMRELQSQDVLSLENMFQLNKSKLLQLESISAQLASRIISHLMRVKHKGPLLLSASDLELLEKEYYYLEFVKDIDNQIFKYSNGNQGLRSKSVIELCGPDGSGKTQWCLTATCNMLQVGKKVAYIDSEGGFDFSRIKQIAKKNSISQRSIRENIVFADIDSFDELDLVLDEIISQITSRNIGMIIIDSIMTPLQNSYPIGNDSNLDYIAQRQLHLRQTMRKLRSIARIHNMIILYTNHTRDGNYTVKLPFIEDEIEDGDDLKTLTNLLKTIVLTQMPMGGQTLSHSSDMRIYLGKSNRNPNDNVFTAKIENCAYLPRKVVDYTITNAGIKCRQEKERNKQHIDRLNELFD